MKKFLLFVSTLTIFFSIAIAIPPKISAACDTVWFWGLAGTEHPETCTSNAWTRAGIKKLTCDTQAECAQQIQQVESRVDTTTAGLPDGTPCNGPSDTRCQNGCFPNGFCGGREPSSLSGGTTNANLPGFIQGSCGAGSIDSAIGCLPTDGPTFAASFFKWSLPIAGLIAFLLIIYGSFLRIISAGNPENMQKAQEIITAALTGLLIVIFAVVILQIITTGILGLPGFNSGISGGGGGRGR